MPRTGFYKSFLRYGFPEEITFKGDLRMSWGLTRERLRGRGLPRRDYHRSKVSKNVALRGWPLGETESVYSFTKQYLSIMTTL